VPWTTWPAVPDGAAGTADAGIGIEPDCPGQAVIGRQLENPRSSAFICGSIREFRGRFESAGQSRQRVADERAAQERNSKPS